jgi:hypothetical protein
MKHVTYSRIILAVLSLLVIAGGVTFAIVHKHLPSPIPTAIVKGANFTVYYPLAAKLPSGYNLNIASMHRVNGALIYRIDRGGSQVLAVSEVRKPSAAELNNFYTNDLPLSTTHKTAIGTASLGAINKTSVVSLPTNGDTWIVMTESQNVVQTQLKQILDAFVAN